MRSLADCYISLTEEYQACRFTDMIQVSGSPSQQPGADFISPIYTYQSFAERVSPVDEFIRPAVTMRAARYTGPDSPPSPIAEGEPDAGRGCI